MTGSLAPGGAGVAGIHGLHWKPQLVETEMPEVAWDEPAGCPGMTRAVRMWGHVNCLVMSIKDIKIYFPC